MRRGGSCNTAKRRNNHSRAVGRRRLDATKIIAEETTVNPGPAAATVSISTSARLLAVRRTSNCWGLFALSTADAHRAHRENTRS